MLNDYLKRFEIIYIFIRDSQQSSDKSEMNYFNYKIEWIADLIRYDKGFADLLKYWVKNKQYISFATIKFILNVKSVDRFIEKIELLHQLSFGVWRWREFVTDFEFLEVVQNLINENENVMYFFYNLVYQNQFINLTV